MSAGLALLILTAYMALGAGPAVALRLGIGPDSWVTYMVDGLGRADIEVTASGRSR